MNNRFDTPRTEPENPWENFEQSYPVAPARVIVITDEMRAEDAAKQAALGVAPDHPWAAVRASLSVENLTTTRRRKTLPGRVPDERRFAVKQPRPPREKKPARTCSTDDCDNKLSPKTKGEVCNSCLNSQRAEEAAERRAAKKMPVVTIHAKKTLSPAATEALHQLATAAITFSEQPPTETNTMSKSTCACGCGTELSEKAIANGWTFAYGHRNGSAKATTKKPSKAAKKSTALTAAPPSLTPVPLTPSADVVMLRVPAAALDAFWGKLSQDEKIRIVTNELLRSHGLQEVASA